MLYLSVHIDNINQYVQLDSDPPSARKDCSSFSYSPIFPLRSETRSPELDKKSTINFFSYESTYEKIRSIKTEIEPLNKTYFSNGLVGLIGFNLNENEKRILRKDSVAEEEWILKDGTIESSDSKVNHSPKENSLKIESYSELPHEFHFYLEEITYSLHQLERLSQIYFPSENKIIYEICEKVNLLIKRSKNPNETNDFKLNEVQLNKRINVYLSALIELSAALSYVLVQGYSGRVPILNNSGPFPSHILLGIGGFIKACTRINRALEFAFRSPITSVIKEKYSLKSSITKLRRLHKHDPTSDDYKWNEADLAFDRFNIELTTSDPLLVHVSLRHGFKEAKFSITSAAQSIVSASSKSWTLVTLSHEFMHSQIRKALAVIFTPELSESGKTVEQHQDFFSSCLMEYEQWASDSTMQITYLQALRFAILEYSIEYDEHHEKFIKALTGKRGKEPVKDKNNLPHETLRRQYLKHKKFISELLVHTLDFFYIYNSNETLYIRSLWISWSTIPVVNADPDSYIIRFLSAIASKYHNNPYQAFDNSIATTIAELEEIQLTSCNSPLIKTVIDRLRNESYKNALRFRFLPAYYITDCAKKFLVSNVVKNSLNKYIDDDNFTETDSGTEYSVKVKDFEFQIDSELGYLVEHLKSENQNDLRDLSAWITLGLS